LLLLAYSPRDKHFRYYTFSQFGELLAWSAAPAVRGDRQRGFGGEWANLVADYVKVRCFCEHLWRAAPGGV